MQVKALRRAPHDARHIALQAVFGEVGFSSVILIAVATGAGLLLDFQFTALHPMFSVGLQLLSIPVSLYWAVHRTLTMSGKIDPEYVRNLALATAAGQAGCISVVLIFLGLFAGLFLDSRLDTHPVFTIGLVLISVPVSLYAMIRWALSSVAAIKLPTSSPHASQPAEQSHTKENGS